MFVWIFVLTFLGQKWIRSALSWYLFCLCLLLHFFVFNSVFSITIYDFLFVESVLIFLSKLFSSSSLFASSLVLCYNVVFMKIFWLFMVRDVWELNIFIPLIHIYFRIILLYACNSIWWISRLIFNAFLPAIMK